MRCCVPFCENTLKNVSTSEKRITFHGFPREARLLAAWLRALGKQGREMQHSSVVCSQHFLEDDFYETESGLRQLVADAIPSTVQVCMICLDTDSKLFLMSKYKSFKEAYKQLTGHPSCGEGKLQQTLCGQCAQRLIDFSHFRDETVKARELLMDLVDKHELITIQHIKHTRDRLKSVTASTTLGPDPQEYPLKDNQTESEETVCRIVVKDEDDSMSVDGHMEVTNPDNADYVYGLVASEECSNEIIKREAQDDTLRVALMRESEPVEEQVLEFEEQVFETQDPLKCESALYQCTLCSEELVDAHTYMQHMRAHAESGGGERRSCDSPDIEDKAHIGRQIAGTRPTHSPEAAVAPSHATEQAGAMRASRRVLDTDSDDPPVDCIHTNIDIDTLTSCVVRLYDCKKFNKHVLRRDGSLTKTRKSYSSCVSQNVGTASKDINIYHAPSQNVVSKTENINTVTNEAIVTKRNVSDNLQCNTDCSNASINIHFNSSPENSLRVENKCFTCDICKNTFQRKSLLVKHIKTHSVVRLFTCKFCQYMCTCKSQLTSHMRTHISEKPYACKLCENNFAQRQNLMRHMKTHSGEKPYSCMVCNYKCARKSHLELHMRTHTGEKPYSCKVCNYKFALKHRLDTHLRTHTGEKPYSCEVCNKKFTVKYNLDTHLRTHTGEKPYYCKVCNYKGARNTHLVMHMKTHTGEKPYSCSLCKYKCALSHHLVSHMRIHTK